LLQHQQRLLNSLCAILFIFFLESVALWIRGYCARDGIWYSTESMCCSLQSYRGKIWFWTLSTAPTRVTWSVWSTPAKIHRGFTWDSTADSWYEQRRRNPKATGLPAILIEPPAFGAALPTDRRVQPMAQLQVRYPTECSMAIYIPNWALVLLLGALPALFLARSARARLRQRRGFCTNCGYDLRASTGRCPECGSAIASRAR